MRCSRGWLLLRELMVASKASTLTIRERHRLSRLL
jgi:hypothetical protein